MSTYSEDQIEHIELAGIENDKVMLDVQPMMESAHYLAGARIERTGGRRQLSLVRCAVGSECAVDAAATVEAGTADPYRLTLEGTETPVDVIFPNGTTRALYEPGV